jgi:hypothetical protein
MDIRYKTLSNDNEFWLSDNYEVYSDIDISSGCKLLLPKKFILDKLYESKFYNIHVIIEDDELFLKPLEFVYEHNGKYLIPNIYFNKEFLGYYRTESDFIDSLYSISKILKITGYEYFKDISVCQLKCDGRSLSNVLSGIPMQTVQFSRSDLRHLEIMSILDNNLEIVLKTSEFTVLLKIGGATNLMYTMFSSIILSSKGFNINSIPSLMDLAYKVREII